MVRDFRSALYAVAEVFADMGSCCLIVFHAPALRFANISSVEGIARSVVRICNVRVSRSHDINVAIKVLQMSRSDAYTLVFRMMP